MSTTITLPSSSSWIIDSTAFTSSGTDIRITTQAYMDDTGEYLKSIKPTRKEIHPKLYFKYIKSKLNKKEIAKLKTRLSKLQKLVASTEEVGQWALHEKFKKQLAIIIRESEADVAGITQSLTRDIINKHKRKVKGGDVSLTNLLNFARPLPKKVSNKLKLVQKKGLFDDYWVLHFGPVCVEEEDLKTTEEKIIEKDPILFGTYSYQPDKFYFIIDWDDEYCNLTLDTFVDTMREDNPDFQPEITPELDEDYIKRLLSEVQESEDNLANTKPSNYRELAAKEKEKRAVKLPRDEIQARPWWRIFW